MARDKTGRHIQPGDVLKVFHFIGARGKRHFMYQQALRYSEGRLVISYLDRIDDGEPWEIGKNFYSVGGNEHLDHYEIVQSVDAKFEDRPKLAPESQPELVSE
jgi:hypothetical protein